MSYLCNVKKPVNISESFSDLNCKKATDNIYYEEAWDLRMARLGIDIVKLNSIFTESNSINNEQLLGDNMTRSCIDPVERQDPTLTRNPSSAIKCNVLANNPVYYVKQCDNTPKSATGSPVKNSAFLNIDTNDLRRNRSDSEHTLDSHIGSIATLRPSLNRGILLNNNCYEFARSQLVNAIIDKDRECTNSCRLFYNAAPSAFKPLQSSKVRPGQVASIYNNHCYTNSSSALKFSGTLINNSSFGRQISAPADSATEISKKMMHLELERNSKTLQSKASRRSMKKAHETSTNPANVSSNTLTIKTRVPVEQHLHESSRISNKLMSKSMVVADESRLSDNYIKHLTGQEIAGNFIKHSQRPECHMQRTDDRYHMGFNDSRLDMIADSNRPLEEHLWYHPFLSRVAAEQLLAKYPEGSFLVRRSESSSNEYSLSIRYKQKWLHMKISRDIDGQFILGQYSQPYPSIPIMIRHYSCSFLPVKDANLISLQQPVFRY